MRIICITLVKKMFVYLMPVCLLAISRGNCCTKRSENMIPYRGKQIRMELRLIFWMFVYSILNGKIRVFSLFFKYTKRCEHIYKNTQSFIRIQLLLSFFFQYSFIQLFSKFSLVLLNLSFFRKWEIFFLPSIVIFTLYTHWKKIH